MAEDKSRRSNWIHVRLTDEEAKKLNRKLSQLEKENRKISASTYVRQQLFSNDSERVRLLYQDIRMLRSEIHSVLRQITEGRTETSIREAEELLKRYEKELEEIQNEVKKWNGSNGIKKSETE